MSTDEKPTDCGINSLFYELDTGDFYYFDGVWKKVGSKVQLQDTGNSGTIQITENDMYDVTDYDYADVNVPGVIPVGTLPILENGTADVASYAEASVDVDYVTVNFNLPAFKRTNPTSLSQARDTLAATTVGNYALFGGGEGIDYSAVVDAYDTSLTRTTPTELSQARNDLAATNIGNYALFGGGSSDYSAVVDAYDTSLTRTTPTELSQARRYLAATTVAPAGGSNSQSGYALFGGGFNDSFDFSDFPDSAVVDAYDTSLTRTTPTELSQARHSLVATTVGNYALFGGGYGYIGTRYATVDAYDTSLTRTTPTELSQARNDLAATNIGNYALFGGGGYSYAVVDAYDTSLTRTTPTGLSQARRYLAATTVAPAGGFNPQSGYALFGGGYSYAVVDAYDTSLTRTTPTELSQARGFLAATNIGNYALFGGGYGTRYSAVVDAYSLASYDIQLFPGTKYNFNNSGEIFSDTMQTINIQGPVVGYMKIKNVNVN